MSPIDDKEKKAIEVVATAAGGLHAVKSAAKEAAHEKLRESAIRARGASRTTKSARTRRRIIDAACSLMEERGSTDFQMSEVSDRCGMSKGSIYYYFSDREELVSAIFRELFEELYERLSKVAQEAPDARSGLYAIGSEFVRSCCESKMLMFALGAQTARALDKGDDPFVAKISEVVSAQLERGKREGCVRQDLDCAATGQFAVGGTLLLAYLQGRDADEETARLAVRAIVDVGMQGVGVRDVGASSGQDHAAADGQGMQKAPAAAPEGAPPVQVS